MSVCVCMSIHCHASRAACRGVSANVALFSPKSKESCSALSCGDGPPAVGGDVPQYTN